MAIQIEHILEEIRKEFEKRLQGPGVEWNKKGMKYQLEISISTVLAKNVDAY